MRALDGKTPTEYLAMKLDEGFGDGEWLHRMELTEESRVKFLFWAHRKSVEYANKFNRVFLFDCTYKTNRYGRPLLHIVGMTPTNDSFSIAFCILPDEKAESYEWALATFFSFLDQPWNEPTAAESDPPVLCTDRDLALLKVLRENYAKFPHLLCIWHINKNVQANCKSLFPTEEDYKKFFSLWMAVVTAPTEEGFDEALGILKKWCEEPGNGLRADALEYLQKVWLIHKEKFVVAWTRQYRHLGESSFSKLIMVYDLYTGNAATSRVEGAHHYMKNYIGSSSADILSVFELVAKGVEAQLNSIRAALADERVKIPTFGDKKLLSCLYRNITRHALRLIDNEYRRLKNAEDPKKPPLRPCTNRFTGMMGLPCAHRLRSLIEKNEAVELTEIHPFWRIDDTPLPFK